MISWNLTITLGRFNWCLDNMESISNFELDIAPTRDPVPSVCKIFTDTKNAKLGLRICTVLQMEGIF